MVTGLSITQRFKVMVWEGALWEDGLGSLLVYWVQYFDQQDLSETLLP